MKTKQKSAVKAAKKTNWKVYLQRNYDLYLMILPGIVFLILFRFVPLYGMSIAFKNYNMSQSIADSPWVGFKWFEVLFENPDFLRVMRNTIVLNLCDLVTCFGGSIVFAILINEVNSAKYKKVVQTISYLPHFLSWVVVGGLITQILNPSGMVMQGIFDILGVKSTNLLLNPKNFYLIATFGEAWKSIGWGTILYLAAMSGIDPGLYEAARIDGAGKIKQIIHITLPGIKFIIVTQLLMKIGAMLGVGFEKVFSLQNDMILSTSEVFSTWNYKMGIINWNMSLSTALSFFEAVVNFMLVFIFDRVAKALGEEGLL